MQEQSRMARLAKADILSVAREELADANEARFDYGLPQTRRAAQILRLLGNPYCFRVGGLSVKVEFLENAPPLQECLTGFLRRKKSGL